MTDRRHVLTGLASLPLAGLAAGARAQPGASAEIPQMGAADARLAAIAAALADLERRCEACPGTVKDTSALDALVEAFEPLEVELAETPADTLDGLLTKIHALDIGTVAGNPNNGLALSVADDVRRLHELGRIMHG